jgi:hypothetical protein
MFYITFPTRSQPMQQQATDAKKDLNMKYPTRSQPMQQQACQMQVMHHISHPKPLP